VSAVTSSAAPAAPAGPRRRLVSHETYLLVFGTVYAGLMTNLLLVVSALPLVALLVTTDPAASWPALALVAPLCAPGLVAAFAVFGAFSADPSAGVARTFWRAYRTHWRRSVAVGAIVTALVVVLAVDVRAVWGLTIGAVAIPVFLTLGLLVVVTALVALAAVPDHPQLRLRDLLRASSFAAVRRWYLSVLSLVALATLGALVVAHPALALGLALAPLLFAVWGGSRYALHAVLTPASTTGPRLAARP